MYNYSTTLQSQIGGMCRRTPPVVSSDHVAVERKCNIMDSESTGTERQPEERTAQADSPMPQPLESVAIIDNTLFRRQSHLLE